VLLGIQWLLDEKEGREEDGAQDHKASNASGFCLAVNRRERSHSKHGPAQEELGTGGMPSAKDRWVAVTCRERERVEICKGMKWLTARCKRI